jgi:hypothetical protein
VVAAIRPRLRGRRRGRPGRRGGGARLVEFRRAARVSLVGQVSRVSCAAARARGSSPPSRPPSP